MKRFTGFFAIIGTFALAFALIFLIHKVYVAGVLLAVLAAASWILFWKSP
jgi:hypothetical protein